jgi:hypothetical protein
MSSSRSTCTDIIGTSKMSAINVLYFVSSASRPVDYRVVTRCESRWKVRRAIDSSSGSSSSSSATAAAQHFVRSAAGFVRQGIKIQIRKSEDCYGSEATASQIHRKLRWTTSATSTSSRRYKELRELSSNKMVLREHKVISSQERSTSA